MKGAKDRLIKAAEYCEVILIPIALVILSPLILIAWVFKTLTRLWED